MKNIIASHEKTNELLKKYGIYANKRLGQNFLVSNNIVEQIVSVADINEKDFVIEIGPGLGSLTQYLCLAAKEVLAVEIDKKFRDIIIAELADITNLTLIEGDILKTDVRELIDNYSKGLTAKVCANLPYYITTPVIMYLLESNLPLKSITVMLQKEVAMRILASPGTKDYGALTLAVDYYAKADLAFLVPSSSFIPKPDVTSAVINLEIREKPYIDVKDKQKMFKIIKSAFGQRRKTLINAILNQCDFGLNKEELTNLFNKINFDVNIRGERLSLTDFAYLSNEIN